MTRAQPPKVDPRSVPMGRLHHDPAYRSLLLEEGIKPVVRVSNLPPQEAREVLAHYRSLGFEAAACHARFSFDEDDLYRFTDGPEDLVYVFVSRDRATLEEMLHWDREEKAGPTSEARRAAMWEVGRLLGYPRCCTGFHQSFTGTPHQSAFLTRPWHATRGAVARGIHPLLRLLGHFFCRLDCPATAAVHGRILEALQRRLPDVFAWVEPSLVQPVLLVEWDLGATFQGVTRGDAVCYDGCAVHGRLEELPPAAAGLADALRGGSWCRPRGRVVEVDGVAHDTTSIGLPPLFMPMDGAPVGKLPPRWAVLRAATASPAEDRLARLTAGDLDHRGYRVTLWDDAASDEVLAQDAVTHVVAFGLRELPGLDLRRYAGDRHALVLDVDAVSVGQEPRGEPRGSTVAHRRAWWPECHVRGAHGGSGLSRLDGLPLCSDPDPFGNEASDITGFLVAQARRHALRDGGRVVLLDDDRYVEDVQSAVPELEVRVVGAPAPAGHRVPAGSPSRAPSRSAGPPAAPSGPLARPSTGPPGPSAVAAPPGQALDVSRVARAAQVLCARVDEPAFEVAAVEAARDHVLLTVTCRDGARQVEVGGPDLAGATVRSPRLGLRWREPAGSLEQKWLVALARLLAR